MHTRTLKISVILLLLTAFFNADLLAGNKLERKIKAYKKAVTKAEKIFAKPSKTVKVKYNRCKKAVLAMEKKYKKFTKTEKINPKIKILKTKHFSMEKELKNIKRKADIEKITNPYNRKIRSMEKAYGKGESSYKYKLLQDDLGVLEGIYARISEDDREISEVKKLHKRHLALDSLEKYMHNLEMKKDKELLADHEINQEFSNKVENLPFKLLQAGKDNKAVRIVDIESLDKKLEKVKQFAIECNGKYKSLVDKNVNTGGRTNLYAKDVFDLSTNCQTYRNQLAIATHIKNFQDNIDKKEKIIAEFKKDSYVETKYLELFLYKFKKYSADLIKQTQSSGTKITANKIEQLKKMPNKFKTILNVVLENNSWSSVKDSGVKISKAIRKKAEISAKKMGLELKEIKLVEDQWDIDKNSLGVPIDKSIRGYVLLHKDGENFYRQHYARFYRNYDGNKYEDASAVNIVSTVSPVKK